jgi:DnaJ-domain-containing protein 1
LNELAGALLTFLSELAGALSVDLLTLLGVMFLLSRGLVLRSRRAAHERDARGQPSHHRASLREQEADRRRQPEQEREAERRQWQRERPARQSEESASWWRVFEVSPDASADEIRRSYLRKIAESHPDRVAWLAPELLPAAERRSKILNAAYAEASRARRGSRSELGGGNPQPSP